VSLERAVATHECAADKERSTTKTNKTSEENTKKLAQVESGTNQTFMEENQTRKHKQRMIKLS